MTEFVGNGGGDDDVDDDENTNICRCIMSAVRCNQNNKMC